MNALLLIDIQNDYFPGGNMELVGSQAAGLNAAKILSAFRKGKMPVIHVQHFCTQPEDTFFIPGTNGVNIHSSVSPMAGEEVVTKNYPNSFRETPLLEKLQKLNPSNLFIAGMMTHMCVDATVRAAFDFGFNCILAHDACATRDLVFNGTRVQAANVQAAFMSSLDGIFARVIDTESACKEL